MSAEKEEWFFISNVQEIDSPALVIYPERVSKNIRTAIEMAGGSNALRPHVKTHKTKEVAALMLEAGISKFKCATIAEAEMLAISKAPDVLLAYQPVGPKIKRFASLIRNYPLTRFSCLIDNAHSARQISEAAVLEAVSFHIFIDLNAGMDRTGIPPGQAAIHLYVLCHSLGLKPVGLHLYDGHVRDANLDLRTKRCDEIFEQAARMRDALTDMGFPPPTVVAGGSPTFSIHCRRQGIECSPGTFVYWDKGYLDLCPEQLFKCAALVITRVVSLPDPTTLCLDLGHKSVAAENELRKRVFFLNAPGLKPVSQSEEHLVVDAGKEHGYKIGDLFYGLPHHICPTCALYEKAVTIEQGMAVGEWRVLARDRRISL